MHRCLFSFPWWKETKLACRYAWSRGVEKNFLLGMRCFQSWKYFTWFLNADSQLSIREPMFFTTPVPLIAGVVSKLNQGTNRQKGRHFLSGSFFVSFLDKQKRKLKVAWIAKWDTGMSHLQGFLIRLIIGNAELINEWGADKNFWRRHKSLSFFSFPWWKETKIKGCRKKS